MTQILTQVPTYPQALRFGTKEAGSPKLPPEGKSTYQGTGELRAWLKDMDIKAEDMVFKPINAPAPDTSLGRARAGLKKVGLPLAIAAGLLVTSVWSWLGLTGGRIREPLTTFASHQANRARIYPNWQKLADVTQTAGKTKQYNDPALVGDFVDHYHGFLYQIQEILQNNPGHLSQTLQEKLKATPDFRPRSNLRATSNDFIDFMKREIRKEVPGYNPDLPNSPLPGPDQLNTIDIKGKFLDNMPELQLDAAGKTALAESLNAQFKQHVSSPNGTHFLDLFVGAAGSGVEGVNLKEFASLSSRQDAERLIDKTLENATNFKHWTAAERRALGTEIKDNILGSTNSTGRDLGFLALMGITLAAGVATGALKRNEFKGLLKALTADIPDGLKNTVLIINTSDLNNPQVRQYLDNAFGVLKDEANSASELFKTSYENDKDFREQWHALGRDEKDLPSADDILDQIFHDTKAAAIAQHGLASKLKLQDAIIPELNFVQALVNTMEAGKESGSLFVKLGLPGGLSAPVQPDVSKAKDPVDALRLRRELITFNLREARKIYLQNSLGALQINAAIGKHDEAIRQIAREAREVNLIPDKTTSGKLKDRLYERLQREESGMKRAREQKKPADLLLLRSKVTIQKLVEDYQSHLDTLTDLITRGEHTNQLDKLNEIQEASRKDLADPRLQEIIDQIEDKEAMEQAIAEREAEELGQVNSVRTLLQKPALDSLTDVTATQ